MGTLSVKENLMFSAALRLPSSTSWAQRKERVATVIQELGLERCANTKVRGGGVSKKADNNNYVYLFSVVLYFCLSLIFAF